ncbi:MAG TPA: hypothetical protein PKE63_00400 [Lacibacter sp.]|nr:hypothetical protein [Lacibacter sp.]HMO87774.1 hypothetical protein [Lacibacter sp.]HMP85702.1 hypothetical protein [Lacibacter sp.]
MHAQVYDVLPLLLDDGGTQQHFEIKLNDATDSFRLEGGPIRRSLFIGRKAFNTLFQFLRNEYGIIMCRILYTDHKYYNGVATTADNQQYRFTVVEGDALQIVLENEQNPLEKITATLPVHLSSGNQRKFIRQLVPSVLAALIFLREATILA